jgi:hypothetical protein
MVLVTPNSAIVLCDGDPNNLRRMEVNNEVSASPPSYRWPWYLAAAVLVGIAIAVMSVRSEAHRVKTEQQYQIPKTEPSAP